MVALALIQNEKSSIDFLLEKASIDFLRNKPDILTTTGPRRDQSVDLETIWERKLRRTEAAIEDQIKLLENTDSSKVGPKHVYDAFEPVINCESEVRLGKRPHSVGDGPKFVCGLDTLKYMKACVIYSIGSNWDFSFELAVLAAGPHCIIHTFDGTMNLTARSLPLLPTNIIFHNWNIIANCTVEAVQKFPSRCVASTLNELKHRRDQITWFKIDCEGCEYEVMPEVLRHVHVQLLMIELHGLGADRVRTLFREFSDHGLLVFHKERNHWGCDGYRCLEFSLMTRAYAKAALASFIGYSVGSR